MIIFKNPVLYNKETFLHSGVTTHIVPFHTVSHLADRVQTVHGFRSSLQMVDHVNVSLRNTENSTESRSCSSVLDTRACHRIVLCRPSLSCFKQQWLTKVSSHRWDFLKHEHSHKEVQKRSSFSNHFLNSMLRNYCGFFVHWHLKHGAYSIFNSKWLKLLQAIPTGLFVEAMTCSCCWNCQRDSWWNFCKLRCWSACLIMRPASLT